MLRFPERWQVRAPRTTSIDDTTGNPVPGPRPTPVEVNGSLEQRFPDSDQREVGNAIADERTLVLEPAANSKVAGGITKQHQAIGPDGTVWSIVRVPVPRKRRRTSAPIRYLALVVRRSTDIKEN